MGVEVVGVATITGWVEVVVVVGVEAVVEGVELVWPKVTLTVPPPVTVQVDEEPLQPSPLQPEIDSRRPEWRAARRRCRSRTTRCTSRGS